MTIPVLGGVGRYLGRRLKQTMFPLRTYLFLVTKPTTQPLLVPSVSTCLSHSISCKHTHPVSLSKSLRTSLSLSLSLSQCYPHSISSKLYNSLSPLFFCEMMIASELQYSTRWSEGAKLTAGDSVLRRRQRRPVRPDVKIKRNPMFPIVAQKVTTADFT